MPGIYEKIGVGYDTTRHAEPSIADGLVEQLQPDPAWQYLEVACGTGNYTSAVQQRGVNLTGIDLSTVMLDQARQKPGPLRLIQSDAAVLPFAEGTFDGAISVNAVHHFPSMFDVFKDVRRVLRDGRFVVFTGFAEQMEHYWIREYFPETFVGGIDQMPHSDEVVAALLEAGFESVSRTTWEVPENMVDQFLYSGKHKPELYFNPKVLSGISTFPSFAPDGEVEAGLVALKRDMETGALAAVKAKYDWDGGDYMFVTAQV